MGGGGGASGHVGKARGVGGDAVGLVTVRSSQVGQVVERARYSCSGTLDYLTYLGGSDRDEAYGVAADPSGFAYVTGGTAPPAHPTLTPLQPSLSFPPEGDAFVTKLDPSGSRLAYSTYLEVGGDVAACAQAPGQGPPFGHQCGGIAVNGNGEAYVTAKGVFVAKLCPSGA